MNRYDPNQIKAIQVAQAAHIVEIKNAIKAAKKAKADAKWPGRKASLGEYIERKQWELRHAKELAI